MARAVVRTFVWMAASILGCTPPAGAQQSEWRTEYERSNCLRTGRYQEAVDFCRRIEKASPWAKVIEFGRSPEGRPMIALHLSRARVVPAPSGNPRSLPAPSRGARRGDIPRPTDFGRRGDNPRPTKPLIMIESGIHAGEIEGKDASLILAREICVTKKEAAILDRVDLLIVPVFNVDGHERFGPYHRINQNGPAEMGFRSTASNLNLNRDWTRADAPEMKAMLRLIHDPVGRGLSPRRSEHRGAGTTRALRISDGAGTTRVLPDGAGTTRALRMPDFFFDIHTTDGADWQYAAQITVPYGPHLDPGVSKWSRAWTASTQVLVEKDGYLLAPYYEQGSATQPERGFSVADFSPRYSTGYWPAINRPNMLVETHMLKPYKFRVETTLSLLRRGIAEIGRTAKELLAANEAADAADRKLAPGTRVTLTVRPGTETRPYIFRGWKYTPFRSDLTGGMVQAWEHTPVDTQTTIRSEFESALTVEAPAAYAIPPGWTEVIERLKLHGFRMTRLKKPIAGDFETARLEGVRFPAAPFEGRFAPSYTVTRNMEERTLPAGTVIVKTNQPGARLLMHLLEPEAPDSLVKWGLFNTIFERKEYYETYSFEPIAKRMLETDPKLKAEYEEKLKDPAFTGRARLDWLFARSPYNDERVNRYPVVRLR